MDDIGLLPILNRIANAALSAHRCKKGATDIHLHIVEAVEPMARELVLIGMDQAIIAADKRATEFRRSASNPAQPMGEANARPHHEFFALQPDP